MNHKFNPHYLILGLLILIGIGFLCVSSYNTFRQIDTVIDDTASIQKQVDAKNEELSEISAQLEAQKEKEEKELAELEKRIEEERRVSANKEKENGQSQLTPSPTAEASVFENSHTSQTGKKIGIDPGHQGSWVDMSQLEPNAPGSSEMKARCTTGTQGVYTNLEEYQLNLDVSKKLKDILEERGYEVVMTREDHNADISNAERAQLVAEENCDIYVRIHANGDDSHTASGALTMCPSSSNPYVGEMYQDCLKLSQTILDSYCQATGFDNKGIIKTDTMTGINWSSIPVTIIEMGFMTNPEDDRKMADPDFQDTMAEGIANGIDAYFAQS